MTVPIHTNARTSVDSHVLGTLRLPALRTLVLPRGLIGFPDATHFAFLPTVSPGIAWIQCLENPSLTFLTIEPYQFVDRYELDLHCSVRQSAGIRDHVTPLVLGMVTLPQDTGGTSTVNLEGPIVIDATRQTGAQILVPDSEYGPRHPVLLPLANGSSPQVRGEHVR